MPHSLRTKIKGLRYKGIITDKDCDRLCKSLDNEDALDKIRAEIEAKAKERELYLDMGHPHDGLYEALEIINKHTSGKEQE